MAGVCSSSASCNPTADSFIFQNSLGETVSYIDSNGNLCVETGDCTSSVNCNNPGDGSFIVKDVSNDNAVYISSIGDLCFIGALSQNTMI